MADERPKCYFMECEGGRINPAPPKPSPITPPIEEREEAPGPKALSPPKAKSMVCRSRDTAKYCASSALAPQYGFNYIPTNIIDNDLTTAWVEGVRGNGEGEWISVEYSTRRRISRIEILNGYHKNEVLFRKNGRLQTVEIHLSDGLKRQYDLEDRGGLQKLDLGGAHDISWAQLIIRSVYTGTKYEDTAISEVRFAGK